MSAAQIAANAFAWWSASRLTRPRSWADVAPRVDRAALDADTIIALAEGVATAREQHRREALQ